LRNPPLLEHTGTGQFTITNADPRKDYAVFTTGGVAVSGTTVSNGVVELGNNTGGFRVSYASQPNKGTTFSRLPVTTHGERRRKCDPCNPHCLPGCGGSGSPTCNPPGQDNDACYSCCWGCGPGDPRVSGQCCCPCSPNCYDVIVQIKDSVPTGYVERYGEWVQIVNPTPEGRASVEQEGYVEPFNIGDWPNDYYISFTTPEKSMAPIDVATEENQSPDEAEVFNYTIFATFFDEDDNIYLNVDSQNEPELFEFNEGFEQEVFMRNINGLKKGRWEMVWLGPGKTENYPFTNVEDTYTLLKELSGNVG